MLTGSSSSSTNSLNDNCTISDTLENALKYMDQYLSLLDRKLTDIEQSVKSADELKQAVDLHERFNKLLNDHKDLVCLNDKVLSDKKEVSERLHTVLIQTLARVQKLQGRHGIHVGQDYNDLTQNALSFVTDWKLDLEQGTNNATLSQ